MNDKLKTRIINGVESDRHFLYTDKNSREWSVLDFGKLMSKAPEFDPVDFGYSWEAMYFGEDRNEIESDQYRGFSAEEVIKKIDESITPSSK